MQELREQAQESEKSNRQLEDDQVKQRRTVTEVEGRLEKKRLKKQKWKARQATLAEEVRGHARRCA